eukprot:TRINITY_DN15292_c0_g1_i1.p1 TRINITY_DN15292_c0_g1~~TRINITY_DN15292_c0_g1_i1.p1  ORF type:complete len:431 (-),score=45.09 TRINITY_DN15292_c0_g1_i1:295-1587(-)
MSERLRGRVARPHELTVVTVGDCKVGKTALINRFCDDVFIENYAATSFNRYISDSMVANKRVRYTIWDTTGVIETNTTRTLAFREADVFLLCYKISDPSTLFSAINHWVPDLRQQAPSTPIVLVGCQSDLRTDRTVIQTLAKVGKSPVSSQLALSMSQQIDAVMYVETSAKTSGRGAASVMEVAALTSLGQFSPPRSTLPLQQRQSSLATSNLPPSPLISKKHRNRSLSISRQRADNLSVSVRPELSLTRESTDGLYTIEPSESFWEQFTPPAEQFHNGRLATDSPLSSRQSQESPNSPILNPRSKMGSLSSMSMRSKSSTLSSTRSDSSMQSVQSPKNNNPISITTTKTPKNNRKVPEKEKDKGEKMITIKCQRLTADKTYEEVEIEVPAPIYETMQNYTDNGSVASRQLREKRGFGTKIKCLFSKTAQ